MTLKTLSALLVLGATLFAGPALADATSSVPSQFHSDHYVEADYEDFCGSQSSGRQCIDITIKNSSRATLDWKDDSQDGSLTGSGALTGFQVFEIPGCVAAKHMPKSVQRSLPSDDTFARRMRAESLHYWKPGRHKTIKVLKGCTYAVAVKREIGDHKWHVTYIPATAKSGCTLNYKYVTKKADLKSYERWALFGATGGEIASLAGAGIAGGYTFVVDVSSVMATEEIALSFAIEDAAQAALPVALEAGVYLVGAVAVYEAGLWSAYGIEELIDVLDGQRDFTLDQKC